MKAAITHDAPSPDKRRSAGTSDTATGVHGDQCGQGSGVDCINGTCLNLFQNPQTGDPIGACLSTCDGKDSCPQGVDFLGGQAGTQNAICLSILLGWNGTADPRDNIYLPVCLPEATTTSLNDCSTDFTCPANEACQAFPIATNPGVPAKVEYLCVGNTDAQGVAPTGAAGSSCTGPGDCASAICANDTTDGFCSHYCDPEDASSCADVPNSSCQKQILIPRAVEANEAAVWTCQKTDQTCLPCSTNFDCTAGFVCANVSATAPDFRCVADCSADGTCAVGTCQDTTDQFAGTGKGCVTTCQ